jgi:hypothetical protein
MNTAEDRSQWPSHYVVSRSLSPAQEAAIDIAEAVKRLAVIFQNLMRAGNLRAADRVRAELFQMSGGQALGRAWLEAYEEAYGPMPLCQSCGALEIDCECPPPDLDIDF